MRNRNSFDQKPADRDILIFMYNLIQLAIDISDRTCRTDACYRSACCIDRYIILAGQHADPADMVNMFMRHKNRIQILAADPDRIQSLFDPLSADPRIDQDMRCIIPHINAVSTASTRNTK